MITTDFGYATYDIRNRRKFIVDFLSRTLRHLKPLDYALENGGWHKNDDDLKWKVSEFKSLWI